MKSQTDVLLSVAEGICKDIQLAYPTLKGLSRDLSTLTLLVECRGLGVFTLDLPRFDEMLLHGLEFGSLQPGGFRKKSKRCQVPRLFSGLWLLVFNNDLSLRSEPDVTAIAFLRQLCCLGKKIEVPCSKERRLAAIKDYFHVESVLPPPTLRWADDSLGLDGVCTSIHLRDHLGPDLPLYPNLDGGGSAELNQFIDRCQRISDLISEELGTYCPDCYISSLESAGSQLGLRHGPGAVAERSGRHFNKYAFTNWSSKLSNLFPFSRYGKMPLDPRPQPRNHEVPARLICVPKTAKGPRIIAAEPSEHMYAQKLMQSWLEDRIRSSFLGKFVDFRRQDLSASLVKKASLDRSLATIDLSSASDRLSLFLLERIFRRNPSILRAIHASRTRWLKCPETGEHVLLKKFASQGTAVTFPIQTLVFLAIALAGSSKGTSRSNLERLEGKVRIFGDDIIIPQSGYARTVSLLTTFNLKVNTSKSFSRGYFRESCGMDAYMGYDVTPAKPKTLVPDGPASCQAVLDTINNLFYKGYWYASNQLKLRLHSDNFTEIRVVGRGAGATGYGSYSASSLYRKFVESFNEFVLGGDGLEEPDFWTSWRIHQRRRSSSSSMLSAFRSIWSGKSVLSPFGRIRFNRTLQRVEVRACSFRARARVKPYDDGYSGILDAQLRAPDTGGALPHMRQATSGFGIPERPTLRKVSRWEALELMF